jgi:hypothetical protein
MSYDSDKKLKEEEEKFEEEEIERSKMLHNPDNDIEIDQGL